MEPPLCVLVADTHAMTFYSLPHVLKEDQYLLLPDFARSCAKVLDYCRKYVPDVLVLAQQLAKPFPDVVIGRFREEFPAMRIVLIVDDDAGRERLASLGVAGFLRRSDSFAAWQRCFRVIADGGVYSQSQPFHSSANHEVSNYPSLIQLSERKVKLLRLLTMGLNNKEIGMQLGLSEATVRNNLTALFVKLGVDGRVQAAVWSVQAGVLVEDS